MLHEIIINNSFHHASTSTLCIFRKKIYLMVAPFSFIPILHFAENNMQHMNRQLTLREVNGSHNICFLENGNLSISKGCAIHILFHLHLFQRFSLR